MFKRIFVAVDGGPASNAGLRAAIDLATDQKASLSIAHVLDDAALAINLEGSLYPTYADAIFDAQRETGRRLLDKAAAAQRRRASNAGRRSCDRARKRWRTPSSPSRESRRPTSSWSARTGDAGCVACSWEATRNRWCGRPECRYCWCAARKPLAPPSLPASARHRARERPAEVADKIMKCLYSMA